jgi:DNA-3-methyladenine glycosylase II
VGKRLSESALERVGRSRSIGALMSKFDGDVSAHRPRGNVYLTPAEMEVLTQRWAPFRSLGVYYMWAVAEETGA